MDQEVLQIIKELMFIFKRKNLQPLLMIALLTGGLTVGIYLLYFQISPMLNFQSIINLMFLLLMVAFSVFLFFAGLASTFILSSRIWSLLLDSSDTRSIIMDLFSNSINETKEYQRVWKRILFFYMVTIFSLLYSLQPTANLCRKTY